jgi:putative flippase GtrA
MAASTNTFHRLVALLNTRFVRYVFVGAVGTLFHYGVMIALIDGFGVSATVSAAIGASVGALVNYVFNYRLTFASTRQHRQSVPRFAIVAGLGVAISGLTMKVVTAFSSAHYLFAQFLATALVLVLGFLLNKYWTFGT